MCPVAQISEKFDWVPDKMPTFLSFPFWPGLYACSLQAPCKMNKNKSVSKTQQISKSKNKNKQTNHQTVLNNNKKSHQMVTLNASEINGCIWNWFKAFVTIPLLGSHLEGLVRQKETILHKDADRKVCGDDKVSIHSMPCPLWTAVSLVSAHPLEWQPTEWHTSTGTRVWNAQPT